MNQSAKTTATEIAALSDFEQILERCKQACFEVSKPSPTTKIYIFKDSSTYTLEYTLIKCVARPLNTKEPDLLAGNEHKNLSIVDLDKNTICEISPPLGNKWTHEMLEFSLRQRELDPAQAFDAYLGEQWIGSTEV